MTEVELKLELTDAAADSFLSARLLRGAGTVTQQKAVYFDTPGFDLAKAGLSLRLRHSGSGSLQTVKATSSSAAGLFARSEWEQTVQGDKLVLDDTTPVEAALGTKVGELQPAFQVQVERRSWLVKDGLTEVEVVLDRGSVTAGERSSPICEMELELKRGEISALFDLARGIDAVAPLRLGVLSKAERGYNLARPSTKKLKAEPIRLSEEATTKEAFQEISLSCLRQFRISEDLILTRGDADAIHQARVALRRLRSAFAIFKPLVGADGVGIRLQEELRSLAGDLSEVRNLDVLLGSTAPGRMHDRLASERRIVFQRAREVIISRRARILLLDVVEWIVGGEYLRDRLSDAHEQRARLFASEALDRLRRKLKKRGAGLAVMNDAMRHEVRKDVKRLRYGVEFFQSLYSDKRQRRWRKKFLATLERLQDQLGAINDMATALEVVDRLGIAASPLAAVMAAGEEKERLVLAADESYRDLVTSKRFW